MVNTELRLFCHLIFIVNNVSADKRYQNYLNEITVLFKITHSRLFQRDKKGQHNTTETSPPPGPKYPLWPTIATRSITIERHNEDIDFVSLYLRPVTSSGLGVIFPDRMIGQMIVIVGNQPDKINVTRCRCCRYSNIVVRQMADDGNGMLPAVHLILDGPPTWTKRRTAIDSNSNAEESC